MVRAKNIQLSLDFPQTNWALIGNPPDPRNEVRGRLFGIFGRPEFPISLNGIKESTGLWWTKIISSDTTGFKIDQ